MSFTLKYKGEEINTLLDKAGTALQEHQDISHLAIKKDVEEVAESIPTKVSQLDNDTGYLNEHQDISHLATKGELNGKQDEIADLESIREGANKGATALQYIPKEYVTEEELDSRGFLTSVPNEYVTEEELNEKGFITEHQSLSHLATKTELEGKVDKVVGKQLSTEDFTTLLKEKLESLKNYDDTELVSRIGAIQETIDTLFSKDASSAIESFNEIIAFLEGVEDSENLDSIIASIERQIAEVAKSIPTKVSELENDEGYLTEHQDLNHLATKEELQSGLSSKQDTISDLDTIRSGAAKGATALQSYTEKYQGTVTSVKMNGVTKPPTSGIVDLGTVLTAHQDISGKLDKSVITLYKAAWIATETTGIEQRYTDTLTLPAGTYIISVVLPYAKVGHGNQICIGFSASMAIGVGNTFLDASYGCVTMLAVFTTSTNLWVKSAASANSATWDYLNRGGLAALRIL